jgi:NodT family efflux transporter outer membrane factor (OMF) lipoprotein
MKTGRCPAVSIVILLLSGCTMVGPDFHRPEAVVSPNWTEATDKRVKSTSADYRNWWHVFNDPVLNRLIERAYRENLTLRTAGVRVLEARAQAGIAVGELYPQTQQALGSLQYEKISQGFLGGGARQSGAGQGTSSAVTASGLQPAFWQSQIGFTASWELDFWGKFRRNVESADASWLATVADYDNALVSLTGDVASSYITIRTLEKRINIARQSVETQKESLNIAEAKFRYGAVTQLDVEQAKTLLNDTLASVPSLEAQLRQAKNALSVLLGMAPNDLPGFLTGASDIPVSPTEVVVGIPADLLRRRPDIRSAEYQAAAQSARIGVAKADLYPAFSLTGTFALLSTDIGKSRLGDILKWGSRDILAGPSFQWNILNYGQITNNVRVQDARLQELLITYQNTVLTAQQEVEDNLSAFLKARERAEFLARSTAAARQALDLAVWQYRGGTKDFTTVLTAQQALLNEQDSLAVTLASISSNLVGVYRALGGGWEIREGKDLVPSGMKEEMAKRTDWGNLLTPASYNPPIAGEPKSLIRRPDW